MKKCYKCNREKSSDCFSRDSSRPDGISNKCKECRKGTKSRVFIEHVYVAKKFCTKCGLESDRVNFRKDVRRRDGLHPHCNSCRVVSEKIWRTANGDSIRRRVRAATLVAKDVCRRFAIAYLLDHPCVDCGEADPMVLDFDHLEPAFKRYSMSRLLSGTTSGVSLKMVKVEIDKCVVRCANCHRRRTAQQFGSWKTKLLTESIDETS